MKIIVSAINPLFPDKVIGGSTRHLHNVAVHLGELGHDITILCTQREDNRQPFQWHERVYVLPIFRFKQPFPQPYDTPSYNLAAVIHDLSRHLVGADRFYMHDGEMLFPFLYQDIPTVISLRDNVYPETMLGSYLFQGDVLIAIADYSRDLYLNTAGRFFPELANRTIVINNGLDFDVFYPGSPDKAIFEIVPVDPNRHLIVLHPHRPEASKGLPQTLEVIDRLVHQHGLTNIKTLVPRWFDADLSAEVRAYYRHIEQDIDRRGLRENFLFHDWIPQQMMADYYRLGHVTLALGHFVEAFGNVPYESLACGTPAIAARIATHRSILPDDLLYKVHFDDHDTAASLAAAVLKGKEQTPARTMAYLKQHYGVEQQLADYSEAILMAEKKPPMRYQPLPIDNLTHFRLAPWCYEWGDRQFYHDFLASHRRMSELSTLLNEFPDGFSYLRAEQFGLSRPMVEQWFRDGYLVPVSSG